MLTGTIITALAILAGSAVGLGVHALAGRFSAVLGARGTRLGKRLQTIMMQGISLCVLYVGISGSLKGQNTLVAILSMVIGAVLGELLDLDARMGRLGQWVQDKLSHILKSGGSSVADGFVTASLVFCVGAMAIVGALLDGISSIVYGASLGIGVAFSAAAVFLYQGLIALAASFLEPFLVDSVIAEMTCVGSLLIVALSFNNLGMTKIKIMNLLPAIFLPILLCRIL